MLFKMDKKMTHFPIFILPQDQKMDTQESRKTSEKQTLRTDFMPAKPFANISYSSILSLYSKK